MKRFKDAHPFILGDPNSGITYSKKYRGLLAIKLEGLYLHGHAALFCKFDGVGDQVEDDLHTSHLVDYYMLGNILPDIYDEIHAFGPGHGGKAKQPCREV